VQKYEPIYQPTDPNEVVDLMAYRRDGFESSRPNLLLFNFTVDVQHVVESKPLNAYRCVKLLLQRGARSGRRSGGAAASVTPLIHPSSTATVTPRVVYIWVVPSDVAPGFKLQRKSPASGPTLDTRLEQVLLVLDPRSADSSGASIASSALSSTASRFALVVPVPAGSLTRVPSVLHCADLPIVPVVVSLHCIVTGKCTICTGSSKRRLWCCCILAGVRGELPTYALPRHLDLHSSWRPGYMSRDSPSGGRAGNRLPQAVLVY
jgi:hypothetical protein